MFKSTGVQIRPFPCIRYPCKLNVPGSREKTCKGESSRSGSSLNILDLQKIDVCLVVMESVLKSRALPNPITKCT